MVGREEEKRRKGRKINRRVRGVVWEIFLGGMNFFLFPKPLCSHVIHPGRSSVGERSAASGRRCGCFEKHPDACGL